VDVGADRGIQQLRFTVTFDKRVLELAGSSAGTFVQNAGVPAQFVAQEPSYGVVLVNFDVDNGSAVAGTGSVVLLEFQALKAGTSPVAVEDITLVEQGSAGASSAPSVQPVSVTVE